jgi:PAS domain S-box-containing protein
MDDYKKFYESSPIAFWRTCVENGKFLMANQACATLLGHTSLEDLLKDSSLNFYTNGDRRHLIEEMRAKGEVSNYKVELITKSGDHIWVAITAKINEAEGYTEGSMIDVTSEKSIESRVSVETERLGELQKGIMAKIEELSSTQPILPARNKLLKKQ